MSQTTWIHGLKEAIHDKASFGFQIEYKSTFSTQELDDIVLQVRPDAELSALTGTKKGKPKNSENPFMKMKNICWKWFILF